MGVKEKPDTLPKIFQERMEREGRIVEYRQMVKEKMASGLAYMKARQDTMKEFGYPGPKEERRIHEEWLKTQADEQFKAVAKKVRQVDVEERRIERFEEAIDCLTPNASPSDEIQWIRAHPAMTRRDRMKDKTRDVSITADDVLYAPHGKAPSRAAVNQLIYWANRPTKFYEGLLGEHKKQVEDGGERSGSKADVTLDEIREYFRQLAEEE